MIFGRWSLGSVASQLGALWRRRRNTGVVLFPPNLIVTTQTIDPIDHAVTCAQPVYTVTFDGAV